MQTIVAIANWMWGWPMILSISLSAILLSIELRFFQFRYFGLIFRQTLGSICKKNKGEGSISPVQATCTALASTVGGGNIAGVAVAITFGGPGALFWMWVIALIACIVKYAEIALAIKYREIDPESGEYRSGLMYVLKNSMNWKGLAIIWAILIGVLQLVAPALQASAISATVSASLGIGKLTIGIALASVSALVLFGGIKWIGRFTEICVPLMSVLYCVGAIWIIGMNARELPGILALIVRSAFALPAATGGFAGATMMMAIRNGFARGIYSNGAGLGTSPMAHATAITDMPSRQAMWGVVEVFIDTIVICSFSGIVILLAGVYEGAAEGGPQLTVLAFKSELGLVGGVVAIISVVLFGYSTMLVNCYFAENAFAFVFKGNRALVYIVRVTALVSAVYGATGHYLAIWNLYDFIMCFTVFINIVCLVIMRKDIKFETDRLLSAVAIEETGSYCPRDEVL